jgi:branched-subunit amino acid aminotransferase/4-amino-4-deoxychorismate lyase
MTGCLFAWNEHWDRLEQSAAALHLTLPCPAGGHARRDPAHGHGVPQRHRISRGTVYQAPDHPRRRARSGWIPASRTGRILSCSSNPTRACRRKNCRPATGFPSRPACTAIHPGTLNPAWKTGNYLNNILCLREARARGADEVVITNLAGEVTEAAVANLGFVRDGEVLTPPLAAGMLAGITRELVISHIAPAAGIRIREVTIVPADFSRMEECFMLSTTKDVAPVGSIDGHHYRVAADTLTMRLKAAFADYVRGYMARNTDLQL